MAKRIRTHLRDGYAGNQFTAADIAGGTLVLNFVDKPDYTLTLDLQANGYNQWANDTTASLSGLVGYYQVKG